VTKCPDTNDSCAFLVVGATVEEVMQLRKDMPGWLWIEAPKGWPFDFETRPTDECLDAIIVFARRDREAQTLDVCKRICQEKMMKGVPLLVAASRYQMSLVNKLKQLQRGLFIFTPIDENSLSDTIKEIKGVSS
jgi:hypothetical protein